jgi:predicted phage tail protein
MWCNVILAADLGREFGEHHKFDLDSTAEVFAALRANFPTFRAYQLNSEEMGVGYQVYADATAEDFTLLVVPVVGGASGALRILAGVAVLGIGLFAPFSIGLFGAGVISSTSIGLGLLAGGLSEVLAPKRNGSGTAVKNSTSFNPAQTAQEGAVYTVSYGEVFVVGQIISGDPEVYES